MSVERTITYAEAINEALQQAMRLSGDVVVYGQGVDRRSGVFGTTAGLVEEFGSGKVFDTPVSESAMTGFGLGAALMGMRPVLVHQRMDFMLYSMDQIVNWASIWRFKSNGQSGMPLNRSVCFERRGPIWIRKGVESILRIEIAKNNW